MENLGNALKAWRDSQSLGIRDAAKVIGTSSSTLSRIERGLPCDAKTLGAVIRWLLS